MDVTAAAMLSIWEPNMAGKQRHSPQQQQEGISRKQFGEFLEQHEWITGDISPDLGEDILVRIYEKGVSTGLSFYVQLKSMENASKYTIKSGKISYPFEAKDLEHWDGQATTIVLVVWDIKQKRGWWIWIGQVIEFLTSNNPNWREKDTVNIHFPPENEFNEAGLAKLRHMLANIYYPVVAKGKDLTIHAKFSFPKTPEGIAKLEELNRHFAAGDEVELDGKYIENFSFPDWYNRLYGEIDPSVMYLKIGSTKSKTPVPAKIEFVSSLGQEEIPYVELLNIKKGNEELTVTNEQQNIPLKFYIVVNDASHQFQIKITSKSTNPDKFALLFLRMQHILSANGSQIRLTLHKTGEVINLPVPPGGFSAPARNTIDFLEKLCFIQDAMNIKLNFPENDFFTRMDVQAADELMSIIQNGNNQQNNMIFSVSLKKPAIVMLLKEHENKKPLYFQITTRDSFVELLSQKIKLGPMTQKIKGDWEMAPEQVNEWLGQAQDTDSLKIRLINVELFEEFENWPRK